MNALRNLPTDIQQHVKNKIVKRVVKCLLAEAAVMTALFFMGDRFFSALGPVGQSITYALLLLLPFLLTGVPFKLLDRSWRGTIMKVRVKTGVECGSLARTTKETIYYKNTVILTIQLDSGKTIRRRAYEGRCGTKSNFDEYQVGNPVYHFYGIEPLYVISGRENDTRKCLLCGMSAPTQNKVCPACGHTLIKLK